MCGATMDQRELEIFSIMSASPALYELEAEQVWELLPLVKESLLAKDVEMIVEGDLADDFYIIELGEVSVIKNCVDGSQQELAILKSGDCIGELAVIEHSPHVVRSATVKTLTPVKLLAISIDAMNSSWIEPKTRLQVLANLAQIIGKRLRDSNEQPRRGGS